MARAVERLTQAGATIRSVSRFYQTPAFPAGAGPDFVNAAVAVSATWRAPQALALLHDIEAQAGRVREKRWGQRTLDLDLLACGQEVLPNRDTYMKWHALPAKAQMVQVPDDLILPHPRLHERAFVLIPLKDVAPDWVHPVVGRSVKQMCDALSEREKQEVVALS